MMLTYKASMQSQSQLTKVTARARFIRVSARLGLVWLEVDNFILIYVNVKYIKLVLKCNFKQASFRLSYVL